MSGEACCEHGLQWHHETRGCGYHGFSTTRCPCLLPFDEALAEVKSEARREALEELPVSLVEYVRASGQAGVMVASRAGITPKHLSQMLHHKGGSIDAWVRVIHAVRSLTDGTT
jgi:hypothetical protein